MKLKNNALQELYDTVVNGTITISPHAESSIDKAFRECDEKIQSEIDIWNALEHEARSAIKRLEEDISTLKEHISDTYKTLNNVISDRNEAKSQLNYCTHSRDNWRARAKYAEDEVERLRKAYDELFNAGSRKISEVRRENEAVNKKLEKDLTDAKVRLHFLTHSRDDWKRRVEHAEDEVEALKKDNEDLEKRLMETTEAFDKANADRKALQENLNYYMDIYAKVQKDYNELKSRLNSIYGYDDEYIKKLQLQDGAREIGYEQGQTDLWDKLQNVNDAKPFELATCFPDVTCMDDILSWDLEDFMDTYKKWQEEKEKERLDHMRDYLARFCEGRVCEGCPLESNEFKCGCGYSFKKVTNWDMKIIPDEELERYYEKARRCGTCNLKDGKLFIHDLSHPIESINRGVTKACEQFCKTVRDTDIKLKENNLLNAWECTLEATVEINKDLLEKVCGVKPDDE